MNVAGIDYESFADGYGIRCAIFVSGCNHKCVDCHNIESWNFNYGEELTKERIDIINNEISKRPFLNGVTLTGGDPFYSSDGCIKLIDSLNLQDKSIWIYSGFTFEEIISNPMQFKLLSKCDVLVDGLFKKELADKRLQFKGSSNQRIIDIKQSIKQNEIILWVTKLL